MLSKIFPPPHFICISSHLIPASAPTAKYLFFFPPQSTHIIKLFISITFSCSKSLSEWKPYPRLWASTSKKPACWISHRRHIGLVIVHFLLLNAHNWWWYQTWMPTIDGTKHECPQLMVPNLNAHNWWYQTWGITLGAPPPMSFIKASNSLSNSAPPAFSFHTWPGLDKVW